MTRNTSADSDHQNDALTRVRIDKWLWASRFYKTRSLATQAIEAGHVFLNGERTKPAKEVHIDDLLRIQIVQQIWEIRIRRLADVRGSAGVAQTLYAETEASMLAREETRERRRLYTEPGATIKGRPTKRDRRSLERVRGSE